MPNKILICDDDAVHRQLLEDMLRKFGYHVDTVSGGQAALSKIHENNRFFYHLLILNLVMPAMDGFSVLRQMRAERLQIPVVALTSAMGAEAGLRAVRFGAVDFIAKNPELSRLQVCVRNAIRGGLLEKNLWHAKRFEDNTLSFDDYPTLSPEMERVISLGRRAAKSNIAVILEGEPGVGKEMLARAIQGMGERRNKKLIKVKCSNIPSELIEGVLFGFEKNPATGINERRPGKFQEAHGGTLYLEDIGELPLDVQSKLLKMMQSNEIVPVGASKPVNVNVRLITATSMSLIHLVKRKLFREDLYYRLSVFPILVPPLRERREDIPLLAQWFLIRCCALESLRTHSIGREAMDLLKAYHWPGNMQQLEWAIYRAALLANGDELTLNEFPQINIQVVGKEGIRNNLKEPSSKGHDDWLAEEFRTNLAERDISDASGKGLAKHGNMFADHQHGVVDLLSDDGKLKPLGEIEQQAIMFAIEHCRGNLSTVARELNFGRSTLYRKLKEMGINTQGGGSGSSEDAA